MFLGLVVEDVNDTEEGTGLRIAQPLNWLGGNEEINTQERTNNVATSTRVQTLRLSPSTEQAVLRKLQDRVEMPEAQALFNLMKGFQV